MKRMMALLFALLLLTAPALADTAATQTITSPDGWYAFEVPEDFITIDVQMMQETYTDFTQRSAGYRYGLTGTEMLTQGADAITPENTVMVVSIDGKHSLRLNSIEPFAAPEEFPVLKPWMDAIITWMYTDAGVAQENIHPMELMITGGFQWYVVRIDLVGAQEHIAMITDGQRMYELNIVSPDDQLFWQVMGSIVPVIREKATQTITSPDGSYTIEVPADYIVINDDLVAALEADEAELERILDGIPLDDLEELKAIIAENKAYNSVRVDSPDFLFNLISSTSPMPASMERWIERKSLMDALYISQYTAAGIPEEMIQTMDILEIGGWQWYGLDFGGPGFQFRQRMTIHDGTMYMFSFADGGSNADVITAILESFTIVAQ